MTQYYVGDSVPYAASAATYGYPTASHQYYWTFDDGATAGTATTDKIWSTNGIHSATVKATQPTTGGIAYAQKSIYILQPVVNRYYQAVALSDNKQYVLAAEGTGYIYESTDVGYTLNKLTGSTYWNWVKVAISGDGTKLVAMANDPQHIEYSTDSGATWHLGTGMSAGNGPTVACSDSGSLFAVAHNSYVISMSSNYGATWNDTSAIGGGVYIWKGVSGSSDFHQMIIAGPTNNSYGIGVYISIDYGATWGLSTSYTSDSSGNNTQCASSSTGQYLLISWVGNSNALMVGYSSNYGASWSTQSLGASSGNALTNLCMSDDGSVMYGTWYNGLIYKSTNYGASWGTVASPIGGWCYGFDCDSTGTMLVMISSSSAGVYVSRDSGSNWTTI